MKNGIKVYFILILIILMTSLVLAVPFEKKGKHQKNVENETEVSMRVLSKDNITIHDFELPILENKDKKIKYYFDIAENMTSAKIEISSNKTIEQLGKYKVGYTKNQTTHTFDGFNKIFSTLYRVYDYSDLVSKNENATFSLVQEAQNWSIYLNNIFDWDPSINDEYTSDLGGVYNGTQYYSPFLGVGLGQNSSLSMTFATNSSFTANDSSMNLLNGTGTVSEFWDPTGDSDGSGSMNFTGNATTGLTITDTGQLNFTGNFSIVLRVFLRNNSGTDRIFTRGSADYTVYHSGSNQLAFGDDSGFKRTNAGYRDNKWHNLVFMYNRSNPTFAGLIMYVDGGLPAATNVGTFDDFTNSSTTLTISNGAFGFNGTLGEFRLFPYLLTYEEVQSFNVNTTAYPLARFNTSGQYINSINSTNATSHWNNITIACGLYNNVGQSNSNCSANITADFRVSADNTTNSFWINAPRIAQNGTHQVFNISNHTSAQYFDYRINYSVYNDLSPVVTSAMTNYSNVFTTPWVDNISITPTSPLETDLIVGRGTFFTNSSVSEGRLTFLWFVNNNNVENDSVIGLGNNSLGTVNISVGYVAGDLVNFTVQANNSGVLSAVYASTIITVAAPAAPGIAPSGGGGNKHLECDPPFVLKNNYCIDPNNITTSNITVVQAEDNQTKLESVSTYFSSLKENDYRRWKIAMLALAGIGLLAMLAIVFRNENGGN